MRCLVTARKHVSNTRAIARQLLVNQVPEGINIHAAIEGLLTDGVFCWVRPGRIERVQLS
jgi:hypothetical protein